MTQRFSKVFNQILRTTLDFITLTNNSDKDKDNENNQQLVDTQEEGVEEGSISDSMSDENLIDIDSLMAERLVPEEDDFMEVNVIDVFKQELGGDEVLHKQTVLRQLLLSNKLDLLSDISPTSLLTDEELDLLLKHFQTHKLLVIARVWPQMKTKISEIFATQPFLWLTTVSPNDRLGVHEDCCDLCDHLTDLDQSAIKVVDKKSLTLVLNAFTEVLQIFPFLKCLRLFRFDINEESDQLMAQMFPNLFHLDLTKCRIDCWKGLSTHHKNLRHLILSSTAITDQIFNDIVKNKKYLKTIAVNNTNITGRGLIPLPKPLMRIDIRCCPRLSPNYINEISIVGLPFNQIKYLRLEVVFDDNAFIFLCSALKNLVLLELMANNRHYMRFFTTEGLKQIGSLPNLRSLKLGIHLAVHPIPLIDMLEGCPLMTSFSLDGSECVTLISEEVLSKNGDYWPLLKRLEFKRVDCITEKTIEGLSRLPDLSYLDLTECLNVDDNCFVYNLQKMPKLSYLVVDRCHRLSALTYNAIIQKALTMDSLFSVSMYRSNFFVDYLKAEQLPKNLRLTFSSAKSKRCMTFDGIRVKIFKCEQIHRYFSGK